MARNICWSKVPKSRMPRRKGDRRREGGIGPAPLLKSMFPSNLASPYEAPTPKSFTITQWGYQLGTKCSTHGSLGEHSRLKN